MRFNITAPGFQILQPNESRFMPALEGAKTLKKQSGITRAGRESSTSSHWNHA